ARTRTDVVLHVARQNARRRIDWAKLGRIADLAAGSWIDVLNWSFNKHWLRRRRLRRRRYDVVFLLGRWLLRRCSRCCCWLHLDHVYGRQLSIRWSGLLILSRCRSG